MTSELVTKVGNKVTICFKRRFVDGDDAMSYHVECFAVIGQNMHMLA